MLPVAIVPTPPGLISPDAVSDSRVPLRLNNVFEAVVTSILARLALVFSVPPFRLKACKPAFPPLMSKTPAPFWLNISNVFIVLRLSVSLSVLSTTRFNESTPSLPKKRGI